MKADPFDQQRLLDPRRRGRRAEPAGPPAAHPARAGRRRGRRAGRSAAVRATSCAPRPRCSDLAREQKQAEADVEQVRPARRPATSSAWTPARSSPKDLANLQHEIAVARQAPGRPRGRGPRGDGAPGGRQSAAAGRRALQPDQASRPRRRRQLRDGALADIDRGDRPVTKPREPRRRLSVPDAAADALRPDPRGQTGRHRRGAALASAAARAAAWSSTATSSRASAPPPPTRSCAARTAAASWCAPRSRVCEAVRRRRLRRRGRRRVPGQPGPGRLRRGGARRRDGRGAGRAGRVPRPGDQQRRRVRRADRRAAGGAASSTRPRRSRSGWTPSSSSSRCRAAGRSSTRT